MRYSLNINQPKSIEWELSLSSAFVFAFCYELASWAEAIKTDAGIFYFASRNKVMEELPLIAKKPDTVYRFFKELEEKGLLEYMKIGRKDCIRITEKGAEWNTLKLGKKSELEDENSEKNPNKLGKKSENNSEKNPTNNNTRDNIITTRDKETSSDVEIQKNGSKKFEKHPHLIKAMASDFDVAFSYLSGITTKLHWGAAAAEKINWNAKEIGNLGYIRDSLRNRIEAKNFEANDENILENWRMFLEMTIGLKDEFLSKNFVPSMIYSQFNKIILRLNQQRNGNHTTGKVIFSDATKRDALRELIEEGFFNGRS